MWRRIYNNWLTALENRDPESFFKAGYENKQQMRTMYRRLSDVTAFTEWLEAQVDLEERGSKSGSIFMTIGGA